jgi:hypothetical protein
VSQHLDTLRDVLRVRIFIWPVADTSAARNEEHRDGSDARHEKRIMVSAAHHLPVRNLRGFAGAGEMATFLRAATSSQTD